jgi:hypothetical protein
MARGVKTGGRQKGTPNKVTGTVREMISQSISTELESLPKLLKQLEPKERMDTIIKLLPYLIPKADPKQEPEKPKGLTGNAFIQNFINKVNEYKPPEKKIV